MKEKEAVGNV